jgi:hypothetical protein
MSADQYHDLSFEPEFRDEMRATRHENQDAIDAAAADYEHQLKSYNYLHNKIRRRAALLLTDAVVSIGERATGTRARRVALRLVLLTLDLVSLLWVEEPKERSWREFL